MSNTTQSVGGTHDHNFNVRGTDDVLRCSCGLAFDEWREQEEAKNTPTEATASEPVSETPTETPEDVTE